VVGGHGDGPSSKAPAWEESLTNGGDDVDDNTADAEPCPTRREVLQTAVIINKYLDLEDGPLARKLDTLLDSFKHDLRLRESKSLASTHLL
jgi:hypothetical protein